MYGGGSFGSSTVYFVSLYINKYFTMYIFLWLKFIKGIIVKLSLRDHLKNLLSSTFLYFSCHNLHVFLSIKVCINLLTTWRYKPNSKNVL